MTKWIKSYIYHSNWGSLFTNERQNLTEIVNSFLNWCSKFVEVIWSLISCFSFCSLFTFTGNWSLCRYNYYYYFNKYFSTECRFRFVSFNTLSFHQSFVSFRIVSANVLNYLREYPWWYGCIGALWLVYYYPFNVWVFSVYSLLKTEFSFWPISFRFRIIEWMSGYYDDSIEGHVTLFINFIFMLVIFGRLSICIGHM